MQWIIRHQVALIVPIFCLEFFSMHRQSIKYAFGRKRGTVRGEGLVLLVHFALYGALLYFTLLYGGLNYQIEHHLFPTMPRNNLSRAQPHVRAFCEARGIAYCETGVVQSWREILGHFTEVSRAMAPRASRRKPGSPLTPATAEGG